MYVVEGPYTRLGVTVPRRKHKLDYHDDLIRRLQTSDKPSEIMSLCLEAAEELVHLHSTVADLRHHLLEERELNERLMIAIANQ